MKNYCGIQRADGLNAVCEAHVFAEGQNWITMLGYIHKDRAKPHFAVRLHNVTEDEVAEGCARWAQASFTYDEGKMVMNKSNMMNKAHAHYSSSAHLQGDTLLATLTDMLNTKKYVPNPSFISGAGGTLRHEAAEAFWSCITGQREMTEKDTKTIFFGATYGSARRPGAAPPAAERYYTAGDEAGVDLGAACDDVVVTEGALAEPNPVPPPVATRNRLSRWARNLLRPSPIDVEADGATVEPEGAGRTLGAGLDSPLSTDGSGSHDSDHDFIDDSNVQDDEASHPRWALAQEAMEM